MTMDSFNADGHLDVLERTNPTWWVAVRDGNGKLVHEHEYGTGAEAVQYLTEWQYRVNQHGYKATLVTPAGALWEMRPLAQGGGWTRRGF